MREAYRHGWLAIEGVGRLAAEATSFCMHVVWMFEMFGEKSKSWLDRDSSYIKTQLL